MPIQNYKGQTPAQCKCNVASPGLIAKVPKPLEKQSAASTNIPCSLSDNQVYTSAQLSTVPILTYDEGFVNRLDRHWRFQETKRLKKKQELLKTELLSAKCRINSDPRRWSYELHTEASGLDPSDPSFVEAFEKETVILDKRVQACKSHVVLSTCFDKVQRLDDQLDYKGYNKSEGCTADCEPEWNYEGNGL